MGSGQHGGTSKSSKPSSQARTASEPSGEQSTQGLLFAGASDVRRIRNMSNVQ